MYIPVLKEYLNERF
jgi:hypothetical protein